MNELWRSNKDHYFLVGNDRIVGVASNFGYIKLRQDEGSPKYLNYFEPTLSQFGGGFGYLKDESSELTTFYTGEQEDFKRVYGIGYYKKEVANEQYHIKQIVFAPYGDDPILISKVTITNKSSEEAQVTWFEYWGCFNIQFSFQATLKAIGQKDIRVAKKHRIEYEKSFRNETSLLDGNKGIFNIKYHETSDLKEKIIDFKSRCNGIQINKEEPAFEDDIPPPIFLVSLDSASDGFINNSDTFFGNGGVISPDGLKEEIEFESNISDHRTCFIIKRTIKLSAKESKTIAFGYGYIPVGFNLSQLIKKYSIDPETLFVCSQEKWKNNRMHFKIPKLDWVDRETFWHYYYLRGLMSYDSYFQEHILSQGHVYQYLFGFQGAARDPLQHALPFIYTDPEYVKEIIRYTLKETHEDGEIPYGLTGFGKIMPWIWKPSDLELWILWLTSEYILSSRDINFLAEPIEMCLVKESKDEKSTVKELLFLLFNHFSTKTGRGKHGLIRIGSCDWNDVVVTDYVPEENQEDVKKKGESVLNTAMAVHVLHRLVEMLSFVKLDKKAQEVERFRQSLIEPLSKQWNGKWFRRAWLTDSLGWVGDDRLWLEPQPWALLSKVMTEDQKKILLEQINTLTRNLSPIGAILVSRPFEKRKRDGMAVNGGIWPSINGTLIWALSHINGELGFEEWTKNTLARKAEVYPDIWYGIWSGPDTWNSVFSKFPGHTAFSEHLMSGRIEDKDDKLGGVNWTDFPVLNLHPHAWPLYNIFHLIGTVFTKEGLEFTPLLPRQSYEIKTPLLGFEKISTGFKGHYFPQIENHYILKITLDCETLEAIREVKVNKKAFNYKIKENSVIFQGTGGGNKALTWEIKIKSK